MLTSATTSILVNSMSGQFSVTAGKFVGGLATMSSVGAVTYGYYPNVMLRGSHNPVFGGMSWNATDAPACSTANGWFAVDKVVYTGVTVTSLDLRFEEHCNGLTPALRGAVHWNLY
jgi:hypothetical protein